MAQPPENLGAGAAKATAVVVAEITDIRPTRVIGEGINAAPMLGVILRPAEVLAGKLQPEPKEIVVEFVGGAPANSSEAAASLRKSLPTGKSVWFLLWKGALPPDAKPKPGNGPIPKVEQQFYDIVSLNGGVLAQGKDGVVSPTGEPNPEPEPGVKLNAPPTMRKQAESFQKLSDLVKQLRKLR